MNDKRKRPGRGRVHTVLGFLLVGSWSALNGCSSSSDNGSPQGTGGACGTSVNDPTKYPACACAGSRCVPKNLVTIPGVTDLLTACDQGVCVPDNIVAMGENLQLAHCTSISGAEGRCASTCIGAVANLAAYLPQDTCAQNERCTPCFNPADGKPTGVCGLGCDSQPSTQPVQWAACCQGAGLCAPKSALPQSLAAQLGAESCTGDNVCVPAKPIQTPGYRFPCCTGPAPSNYAGACAPACVIDAGPAGSGIPQGNCAADEKCIPCADPISGNPTGACSDASGQPAKTCSP